MNKRITAGITAFLLSFSAVPVLQAAENTVELDEKVISQLRDENKDGKKDITDLSLCTSLYLKLTDIDDISFLKYADSCEYLSLSGGSITDFSVIKDMKNIASVIMDKISPENLSFLENRNIKFFSVGDGDVSIEERAKYLRAEDVTIPAGIVSVINLYPINLFEGKLVIKDTDIAAFGEYGDMQENNYMNGFIFAKKPGETECSLIVDDTTVKTFRIKVTEPVFADLSASPDSVKTQSIERYYYKDKFTTFIHNSDGSLWTYKAGKYSLFGTNVKEYQFVSSENSDVVYTLTNDGKVCADGKPDVSIFKPVKSIYCNKYGVYSITENNELWFTGYDNGNLYTSMLCDNCTFFDFKSEVYSDRDYNCFGVKHSKSEKTGRYSILKSGFGKHEIKKLIVISDSLSYMTDKEGMLWKISKNSLGNPTAAQITTGVDDIWISYPLSQYTEGYVPSKYIIPAFSDTNGTKFLLNSDKSSQKIENPDEYGFTDTRDEIFAVKERDLDFLHYDYHEYIPSLFEGKMLDNDFMHLLVRKTQDKKVFISFCGYYLSAGNVEKVCGAESDGEDYIIHMLSETGALWEYHIAGQKLEIRNFGNSSQTPTAVPSASSAPSKTPSAVPSASSVPSKTPTAVPSASSVPSKTPSAIPSAKPAYTAADYASAVSYMNGTSTDSSGGVDINKDGKINIVDIILLKELILKS